MAGQGGDLTNRLAELQGFSDEEARRTVLGALRLIGVLALAGAAVAWWRVGAPSAALLLVGAAISGSGVWELYRVMAAMMARMDAGAQPRPLLRVLIGFVLRLCGSVVLLYVSLKYLHGSVFALAVGLALGVISLTVQALRLLKAWTT